MSDIFLRVIGILAQINCSLCGWYKPVPEVIYTVSYFIFCLLIISFTCNGDDLYLKWNNTGKLVCVAENHLDNPPHKLYDNTQNKGVLTGKGKSALF